MPERSGPVILTEHDRRYVKPDGSYDAELMNSDWAAMKAAGKARRKAEAAAKRRKPRPEPNTDYPWFKPGWKW
ncbi:MAG TPA: hypothetical protein VG757_01885 [Devosia sp.]|nr:hypothetical protein [Devosia sp.]